jgi:hypothetical protein
MTSERKDKDSRTGRDEHADLQDGSLKKHGDVLDPLIPRGADQKADDSARISEEDRAGRETRER